MPIPRVDQIVALVPDQLNISLEEAAAPGSQLAAAGGRLSFGKTGRRLEVRSSFRMLIEVHQCLLHSGPKKPPFDNPVAKAERQEVVRFDP